MSLHASHTHAPARAAQALHAVASATRRAWRRPHVRRAVGVLAGALVLAFAFASYLGPDMAFTLMTQAWGCL
jgi:hypothetical protein